MGTTTFLASHVPMPWGNVDTDVFAAWGQWAGGLGSIAGIAAVVVAVLGLRNDRRAAEAQRHQDELARIEREQAVENERHEHRGAQAHTVVASRATVMTSHPVFRGLTVRQGDFPSAGVRVTNHGLRPVLEVRVENVTFTDGDFVRTEWALGEPEVREAFLLSEVLGPGESVGKGHLTFPDISDEALRAQGTVVVTISFLDAEGYRWRRVGTGKPVRISEPVDDQASTTVASRAQQEERAAARGDG